MERIETINTFLTHRVRDSITRPANITPYTAGDVVSDVTSNAHFTFTDALRKGNKRKGLSGAIATARLYSDANVGTKMDAELWIFRKDIVAVADNSPFAVTDTEILTLVGILTFATADWNAGSGNAVSEIKNIGLALRGDTQTLFGQLITRNAYVPVSGEVFTVELIMSQD